MLAALALALLQDTPAEKEPAPFGPMEVGIAAEVLGLHFSEPVLERMREFERLRALPLPNDLAPVLHFAPARFAPERPAPNGGYRSSSSRPRVRPANLEDLAYESLPWLRELLAEHEVTSVELTQ